MLKDYRVDGRDDYVIEYVEQSDDTYKLFARQHPADPYGKSVNECHLYSSTDEICVAAGHEPETLDRAKAIAVHWMEGWSQYVRTGVFPKGSRRVTV